MSVPSAAPLSVSATDWLLIATLSSLWGGVYFFAKVAVDEIPPLTLVLGRAAIATAILVPFVGALWRPALGWKAWAAFTLLGLLNTALPSALVFWGQQYIPSGLAAILNATAPLFTVVVAHFATTDDKLTPARLFGLAAGFFGVVVMIGPDLLREIGTNIAAQLACLMSALCYAFAAVYGRYLRTHPPLVVATGQLVASTALILPPVALIDQPWTLAMPSAAAIASMVGAAVLSTALAYVIFFRLLARAGATNTMLVTFLVPVTAILLGALLLDERLAARHLAGMAAIMIGLAAIDGRPGRALARLLARTRL